MSEGSGRATAPKWADLYGVAPDWSPLVEDEVMSVGDLAEGMRVKMPDGRVMVVSDVSEPDQTGAVTITLDKP